MVPGLRSVDQVLNVLEVSDLGVNIRALDGLRLFDGLNKLPGAWYRVVVDRDVAISEVEQGVFLSFATNKQIPSPLTHSKFQWTRHTR